MIYIKVSGDHVEVAGTIANDEMLSQGYVPYDGEIFQFNKWKDGKIIEDIEAQYQHDLKICYGLRTKEYPPMSDYVDAMVKGDDAAIEAYKTKCLEIKAKYPKPTLS